MSTTTSYAIYSEQFKNVPKTENGGDLQKLRVIDGMQCAFAATRACSEVVGVVPSSYVSRLKLWQR
jgi:hypothetical protein